MELSELLRKSAALPPTASVIDPERLRRLNSLLEQALALPEAERQRWIDALPPAEQAFRPRLAALLARAAVETDTFMQRPVDVSVGGVRESVRKALVHPRNAAGEGHRASLEAKRRSGAS